MWLLVVGTYALVTDGHEEERKRDTVTPADTKYHGLEEWVWDVPLENVIRESFSHLKWKTGVTLTYYSNSFLTRWALGKWIRQMPPPRLMHSLRDSLLAEHQCRIQCCFECIHFSANYGQFLNGILSPADDIWESIAQSFCNRGIHLLPFEEFPTQKQDGLLFTKAPLC